MLHILGYVLIGFVVISIMYKVIGCGPGDTPNENTAFFLAFVVIWPLFAAVGILYFPWVFLTKYIERLTK